MVRYPLSVKASGFVFVVSAVFCAPAVTFAQVDYPPETKAIPIPKPESLPFVEGPFQGTPESLKQFQCPAVVSRREVRDLGALGAAGRAGRWRLVCQ